MFYKTIIVISNNGDRNCNRKRYRYRYHNRNA